MLLKKPDKVIFILVIYHIMEVRFVDRDQVDENLSALSHQEQWEIVRVFILFLHVFQYGTKSFLILLVDHGVLTVSCHVNTIHLFEHCFDLLRLIHVRDRDHTDARLLQELHMGFWNV